jgi:hypothetical protein
MPSKLELMRIYVTSQKFQILECKKKKIKLIELLDFVENYE